MAAEISRPIPVKYAKRAAQVETHMLGPYMESIITEIHQAMDRWRYHGAPADDMNLAVDALLAMLAEAEKRGLA